MSIFDKLRGDAKEPLASKSAVLLGCILMASADGDIDDDELAIVRRLDGSSDSSNWQAAVKAFQKLRRSDAIDEVCTALEADHVMPFLANLIDLAMADGHLAGAEKDLLEVFCQKLEPDEQFLEDAVTIIGIKNTLSTI